MRFPQFALRLTSLFGLVAGCGGVAFNPDAGVIDADPTPDATVETVVTVTYERAPADAVAIFLNADDSLVEVVPFAGGTEVSAPMLPGGSVTAYDVSDAYLVHVVGLAAHDHIYINSPDVLPSQLEVMITVPDSPGATLYEVSTPCGSTSSVSSTMPVTLYDCGGTTDVFVIASGNGAPRSMIVRDITVTAAMTVSSTYKPYVAASLAATGIPSTIDYLDMYSYEYGGNNYWYLTSSLSSTFDAPGTTETVLGTTPNADGAWMRGGFYMTSPDQGSQSVRFNQPMDPTFTLALGDAMTPFMVGAMVDSTGSNLVWTPVGGGGAANAGLFNFTVTPTVGAVSYHNVFGMLATDGMLHIPVLPDAYASANITPTSAVSAGAVSSVRASATDIDQMRQSYFRDYNLLPTDGVAAIAFGD